MKEEILTIPETAMFLKISEATVRRWIITGKLPAFQIGRKYRIRRKDIVERFELRKQTHEE